MCSNFKYLLISTTGFSRISNYNQRCEVHKSCGSCLSTYPNIHQEQELPLCEWCAGCSSSRGQCVPRGSTCPKSCNQVQKASQCPEMKCSTFSDCEKCKKMSYITTGIEIYYMTYRALRNALTDFGSLECQQKLSMGLEM